MPTTFPSFRLIRTDSKEAQAWCDSWKRIFADEAVVVWTDHKLNDPDFQLSKLSTINKNPKYATAFNEWYAARPEATVKELQSYLKSMSTLGVPEEQFEPIHRRLAKETGKPRHQFVPTALVEPTNPKDFPYYDVVKDEDLNTIPFYKWHIRVVQEKEIGNVVTKEQLGSWDVNSINAHLTFAIPFNEYLAKRLNVETLKKYLESRQDIRPAYINQYEAIHAKIREASNITFELVTLDKVPQQQYQELLYTKPIVQVIFSPMHAAYCGVNDVPFRYPDHAKAFNEWYAKTATPAEALAYLSMMTRCPAYAKFPHHWNAIVDKIAEDAECSYGYACRHIKTRFPEGEKAIATNAIFAASYATEILHTRFVEAEQVIADHDHSAYPQSYATKILKGRFPAYEANLFRRGQSWEPARKNYHNHLKAVCSVEDLAMYVKEWTDKGHAQQVADVKATVEGMHAAAVKNVENHEATLSRNKKDLEKCQHAMNIMDLQTFELVTVEEVPEHLCSDITVELVVKIYEPRGGSIFVEPEMLAFRCPKYLLAFNRWYAQRLTPQGALQYVNASTEKMYALAGATKGGSVYHHELPGVQEWQFNAWDVITDKIAESPDASLQYAQKTKMRFAKGEKTIAANGTLAVAYAKEVIHGRFPEAEKIIATTSNTKAPLDYVDEVVKGRFLVFEEELLRYFTTSHSLDSYHKLIIKHCGWESLRAYVKEWTDKGRAEQVKSIATFVASSGHGSSPSNDGFTPDKPLRFRIIQTASNEDGKTINFADPKWFQSTIECTQGDKRRWYRIDRLNEDQGTPCREFNDWLASSMNPDDAILYMQEVAKLGNFKRENYKKIEAVLAQSPRHGLTYAKGVLQGRFHEGEATIAMYDVRVSGLFHNPCSYMLQYVSDVLKQPWPEAEPHIAKHTPALREYVAFVHNYICRHVPSDQQRTKRCADEAFEVLERMARLDGVCYPDYLDADSPFQALFELILKNPDAALKTVASIAMTGKKAWPEFERRYAFNPLVMSKYNTVLGRVPNNVEMKVNEPSIVYCLGGTEESLKEPPLKSIQDSFPPPEAFNPKFPKWDFKQEYETLCKDHEKLRKMSRIKDTIARTNEQLAIQYVDPTVVLSPKPVPPKPRTRQLLADIGVLLLCVAYVFLGIIGFIRGSGSVAPLALTVMGGVFTVMAMGVIAKRKPG